MPLEYTIKSKMVIALSKDIEANQVSVRTQNEEGKVRLDKLGDFTQTLS